MGDRLRRTKISWSLLQSDHGLGLDQPECGQLLETLKFLIGYHIGECYNNVYFKHFELYRKQLA